MILKKGKLTYKQKAFIQEFIKTKNGTQSALKVYDTTKPEIAKSIASENLSKPYIKEKIDYYLRSADYNATDSIKRLKANAEAGAGVKATASDSIRADELLLKVAGHLIDKSQSVSVKYDLSTLPPDKLMKEKERLDKLLNKE